MIIFLTSFVPLSLFIYWNAGHVNVKMNNNNKNVFIITYYFLYVFQYNSIYTSQNLLSTISISIYTITPRKKNNNYDKNEILEFILVWYWAAWILNSFLMCCNLFDVSFREDEKSKQMINEREANEMLLRLVMFRTWDFISAHT